MPSSRRAKKLRARSRKISDYSVNFSDVRLGDIYWLPPKENCEHVTLITEDIKIDDGCYDHPVLILAIHEHAQLVLALGVSS